MEAQENILQDAKGSSKMLEKPEEPSVTEKVEENNEKKLVSPNHTQPGEIKHVNEVLTDNVQDIETKKTVDVKSKATESNENVSSQKNTQCKTVEYVETEKEVSTEDTQVVDMKDIQNDKVWFPASEKNEENKPENVVSPDHIESEEMKHRIETSTDKTENIEIKKITIEEIKVNQIFSSEESTHSKKVQHVEVEKKVSTEKRDVEPVNIVRPDHTQAEEMKHGMDKTEDRDIKKVADVKSEEILFNQTVSSKEDALSEKVVEYKFSTEEQDVEMKEIQNDKVWDPASEIVKGHQPENLVSPDDTQDEEMKHVNKASTDNTQDIKIKEFVNLKRTEDESNVFNDGTQDVEMKEIENVKVTQENPNNSGPNTQVEEMKTTEINVFADCTQDVEMKQIESFNASQDSSNEKKETIQDKNESIVPEDNTGQEKVESILNEVSSNDIQNIDMKQIENDSLLGAEKKQQVFKNNTQSYKVEHIENKESKDVTQDVEMEHDKVFREKQNEKTVLVGNQRSKDTDNPIANNNSFLETDTEKIQVSKNIQETTLIEKPNESEPRKDTQVKDVEDKVAEEDVEMRQIENNKIFQSNEKTNSKNYMLIDNKKNAGDTPNKTADVTQNSKAIEETGHLHTKDGGSELCKDTKPCQYKGRNEKSEATTTSKDSQIIKNKQTKENSLHTESVNTAYFKETESETETKQKEVRKCNDVPDATPNKTQDSELISLSNDELDYQAVDEILDGIDLDELTKDDEAIELASEPQKIDDEAIEVASEPQKIDDEAVEIASEPQKIDDEAIELASEPQKIDDEAIELANAPQKIDDEAIEVASEPQKIEPQKIDDEVIELASEPQKIHDEAIEVASEPQNIDDEAIEVVSEPQKNDDEAIKLASDPQKIYDEAIKVASEPPTITKQPENTIKGKKIETIIASTPVKDKLQSLAPVIQVPSLRCLCPTLHIRNFPGKMRAPGIKKILQSLLEKDSLKYWLHIISKPIIIGQHSFEGLLLEFTSEQDCTYTYNKLKDQFVMKVKIAVYYFTEKKKMLVIKHGGPNFACHFNKTRVTLQKPEEKNDTNRNATSLQNKSAKIVATPPKSATNTTYTPATKDVKIEQMDIDKATQNKQQKVVNKKDVKIGQIDIDKATQNKQQKVVNKNVNASDVSQNKSQESELLSSKCDDLTEENRDQAVDIVDGIALNELTKDESEAAFKPQTSSKQTENNIQVKRIETLTTGNSFVKCLCPSLQIKYFPGKLKPYEIKNCLKSYLEGEVDFWLHIIDKPVTVNAGTTSYYFEGLLLEFKTLVACTLAYKKLKDQVIMGSKLAVFYCRERKKMQVIRHGGPNFDCKMREIQERALKRASQTSVDKTTENAAKRFKSDTSTSLTSMPHTSMPHTSTPHTSMAHTSTPQTSVPHTSVAQEWAQGYVAPAETVTNNEATTRTNVRDDPNYPFKVKRVRLRRDLENTSMETYGLSLSYLGSLGIRLPLTTKVRVTNVNPHVTPDHKNELKDIFSLAGNVTEIFVVKKNWWFVDYRHPLEAVQAVSMFNGQKICGSLVNVKLSPYYGLNLPPGLESVGPGLGLGGYALPYPAPQIEMEPLKRAIRDSGAVTTGDNDVAKDIFDLSPNNKSKAVACNPKPTQNSRNQQSNASNVRNAVNQQANNSNTADVSQTQTDQPTELLSALMTQLNEKSLSKDSAESLQKQLLTLSKMIAEKAGQSTQSKQSQIEVQKQPTFKLNQLPTPPVVQSTQNNQNQIPVQNQPTFNPNQLPPQPLVQSTQNKPSQIQVQNQPTFNPNQLPPQPLVQSTQNKLTQIQVQNQPTFNPNQLPPQPLVQSTQNNQNQIPVQNQPTFNPNQLPPQPLVQSMQNKPTQIQVQNQLSFNPNQIQVQNQPTFNPNQLPPPALVQSTQNNQTQIPVQNQPTFTPNQLPPSAGLQNQYTAPVLTSPAIATYNPFQNQVNSGLEWNTNLQINPTVAPQMPFTDTQVAMFNQALIQQQLQLHAAMQQFQLSTAASQQQIVSTQQQISVNPATPAAMQTMLNPQWALQQTNVVSQQSLNPPTTQHNLNPAVTQQQYLNPTTPTQQHYVTSQKILQQHTQETQQQNNFLPTFAPLKTEEPELPTISSAQKRNSVEPVSKKNQHQNIQIVPLTKRPAYEPAKKHRDTLHFSNEDLFSITSLPGAKLSDIKLPPSVTCQALLTKMKQVGDVMFSEMIGKGRAMVRFKHERHAEKCYKLFNRSKVDDQVIEVKFAH